MPYLASARGDYLRSARGDPGIFGFIGKAIKGAAGIVSKAGIPGISGIAGVIAGRGSAPRAPVLYQQPIMQGQRMPGGALPVPGIKGAIQRAVPGGATGYMTGRKRRRMNPANAKALRRAIRRQDSFVRLAKKALKGSGYTVVTRGSQRSRGRISVRESGPGSVTVRG